MRASIYPATLAVALLALSPYASGGGAQLLTTRLVPVDADPYDILGASLALHGDTLLVGAAGDDDLGPQAGAVHVFTRTGTIWSRQAKLHAGDGDPGDEFGTVALDGDTAVVGAYLDEDGGSNRGSTYVFVRSGTDWVQEAKLLPAVFPPNLWFGRSVAVDGDTLIVGSPGTSSGFQNGVASVFVRSGTSWSLQSVLVPPDSELGDGFGASVDLCGDTAVVGAPDDDTTGGLDDGSAYVFVRSGSAWAFQRKFRSTDVEAYSHFGRSVAIHGDTVLVGAPSENGPSAPNEGAVYAYVRSGAVWTEQAVLFGGLPTPSDPFSITDFGRSVDLEDDLAVVGATGDDEAAIDAGAVFVFVRSGTTWTQRSKLVAADAGPPDAGQGDYLGTAVALHGGTAAVGAGLANLPGLVNAGAAYVFAAERHPSFCDAADGSLASCPCANAGDPESGCDISQTTGGVRLDVLAQETTPENRFTLQGSGYPPGQQPAAIVIRATGLDPAAPVVFGDGLRCIGVPLVRLGATVASGGLSLHARGHPSMDGTGDFYYQLWFRNTPTMYCTPGAFNLSNGRILTW